MRIYQDPSEMVREVERDLFEMGHRYQTKTVQAFNVENDPKFETIELFGYAYQLLPGWNKESMASAMQYMDVNETWANAELIERVHGTIDGTPLNPGLAWRLKSDLWKPMLRKDGTFAYSYAERWQAQLPYVIRELTDMPTTRQAVMTMYDDCKDRMNWRGHDRVPCSLTYQFAIRNGKLDLVYNQRSCDFLKFFMADVFFTVGLQAHVANEVGVPVGTFTHFLGSLHVFKGDMDSRNIF